MTATHPPEQLQGYRRIRSRRREIRRRATSIGVVVIIYVVLFAMLIWAGAADAWRALVPRSLGGIW